MIFAEISAFKDLASWLYKRLQKDDPEAAEKVTEMQAKLFDFQTALLERQEEFRKLLADRDVLKEQLDHRRKLVRRDAYYEFAEPVDGYGKGPFCLQCTDVNRFPVGVPVRSGGHFTCSSCGATGWLAGKEEEYDARMRTQNMANQRRDSFNVD